MCPRRLPRRRPEQGRIRLPGPLRLQVLRRQHQGQREDAGRSRRQQAGWRHGFRHVKQFAFADDLNWGGRRIESSVITILASGVRLYDWFGLLGTWICFNDGFIRL